MVRFGFVALLAVVATIFTSAHSIAAPVIIGDELDVAATKGGNTYSGYSSPTFINQQRGGKYWGDAIQGSGNPFDTTQITVTRNDSINRIDFDLQTWFDGEAHTAKYADLFFDVGTPDAADSFGFAVALGNQTKSAGVYTIDTYKTSNDIWASKTSYIYGGYVQFKTTSENFDPNLAFEAPVRLTSGNQLTDYTVVVTQTSIGGGIYNVNVAITAASDLSLFDSFDVFWATADCNNDAIWGTVVTASEASAPNALAIFGLGLLGAGYMRRRKAK